MCGIAGVVGSRLDARSLIPGLLHRGPDGHGGAAFDGGSLAMTRLAILDPTARSDQPMEHDGALLVYNGELYNHSELRSELEAVGRRFATSSDTEVVLFSLLEWGLSAVDRFRGMYAFLLWRPELHELWVARDSLGIKPLYWASLPGGGTAFASEARPLSELLSGEINLGGVAEFLQFGSPYRRTVESGVSEFPVGRAASVSPSGAVTFRAGSDSAPTTRTVRHAMVDAVASHLTADRPVALFLSGGFDSTLLAAAAAAVGEHPCTFTLDTGHNRADVDVARRTAAHYRLEHHVVRVSAVNAQEALVGFVQAMDQPTIDGFNTYLLSDAVNAAGFPVALSGLGGDELFGGYGYYRHQRAIQLLGAASRRMPRALRRRAVGAVASSFLRPPETVAALLEARNAADRYLAWRTVFTRTEVRDLIGTADLPALELPAGPDTETYAELDRSMYLRATLLRDADVFSMSAGVELRVPLLDEAVLEAVGSRSRSTKPEVAALFEDPYLRAISVQQKRTFSLPLSQWLGEFDLVRAVRSDADAWVNMIEPRAASRYLDSGDGKYHALRAWALVILSAWLKARVTPRRIAPRSLQ